MACGELKRCSQEAVSVVEPFHESRKGEHSAKGHQSENGQVADYSVCGGGGGKRGNAEINRLIK